MAPARLPTAGHTFPSPASCCQGIPVSTRDAPDLWPAMEKDTPYSCKGQHPGFSHAYSSLRLPLLQAVPVQAPSSSENSAVPSIYLGQEQSPKGQQYPAKKEHFCFTEGAKN